VSTSTTLNNSFQQFDLDDDVEIDPLVFTHLWENLQISADFGCTIAVDINRMAETNARQPTTVRMFNVNELSTHLKKMGFFIVAAGTHADGFVKFYVFAQHTPITVVSPQLHAYMYDSKNRKPHLQSSAGGGQSNSIYFVGELKVSALNEQSDAYVVNDFHLKYRTFRMNCVVKCTDIMFSSMFIAEFNFGDIYRLV
jgi:hypothetical protein